MISLDCLNIDKQNLEEEIKFFKAKVENLHSKNIQSDPNLQLYLRQQYEEELNYYKNQTKAMESVISLNFIIENSRIKSSILRF